MNFHQMRGQGCLRRKLKFTFIAGEIVWKLEMSSEQTRIFESFSALTALEVQTDTEAVNIQGMFVMASFASKSQLTIPALNRVHQLFVLQTGLECSRKLLVAEPTGKVSIVVAGVHMGYHLNLVDKLFLAKPA